MALYYDAVQDDISKASIDVQSITRTVVPTGTTQATATLIKTGYTEVTATAAGTALRLPQTYGVELVIFNRGSNALLIFPPVGGSIDGGAANTAVSVAAGGKGRYVAINEQTGVYYSA